MNSKLLSSVLALTVGILPVLGWGQKGHDTTAYIAQKHLTSTTINAIDSLLDGKSLVYWSNWLDNASHTPQFAYTKTWHYKNIDEGENYYCVGTYPSGDVVSSIESQIVILKNDSMSKDEKSLALKVLVHLLGDLHQPMHLGHATDRGANKVKVKFFEKETNLHSVWDSYLPESAHKWSYSEWQEQVDRIDAGQEIALIKGSVNDWGNETYQICRQIYGDTPAGTVISYDYIAYAAPIIEKQFLRGGVRLAYLLNSIFDEEYNYLALDK